MITTSSPCHNDGGVVNERAIINEASVTGEPPGGPDAWVTEHIAVAGHILQVQVAALPTVTIAADPNAVECAPIG
jgi:hypothetical protein